MKTDLSFTFTKCLIERPQKEERSTYISQPMLSEVSSHSLTEVRATSCESGKDRNKDDG